MGELADKIEESLGSFSKVLVFVLVLFWSPNQLYDILYILTLVVEGYLNDKYRQLV